MPNELKNCQLLINDEGNGDIFCLHLLLYLLQSVILGESSLVEYRFDATEIDYGKQMYDQVASSEITLVNKGRVGFDFEALNMEPSVNGKPQPGAPLLIPHKVRQRYVGFYKLYTVLRFRKCRNNCFVGKI